MASKSCAMCGEEFTNFEIKQLKEAEEEGIDTRGALCKYCLFLKNHNQEDEDIFSDADLGL